MKSHWEIITEKHQVGYPSVQNKKPFAKNKYLEKIATNGETKLIEIGFITLFC